MLAAEDLAMTDAIAHSDEERAAHELLTAAAKVLADDRHEVPAEFVTLLFERALPEDLMRYDAREIAVLAAEAWALFGERHPGTPRLRLATPVAGDKRLKAMSVLEVINDDMPFLVDSVMGVLADRGLDANLVVHPIFTVQRDSSGRLLSFERARPAAPGMVRESFIHVHLARIDDEGRRNDLKRAIEAALMDVRVSVQDWRAMLDRVAGEIADLKNHPPPLPVGEIAEAIQFLQWLTDDNFTFLGVRNYEFATGEDSLDPVFESGLGILRASDVHVVQRWNQPLVITPEIRAFLKEPTLLIVTKSAVRSRVHRRVYMDYVGLKRFDAAGRLIGEFRIIGLFTSTAYTRSARTIPYLRRKIDAVLTRAGFDPNGHSGKALINVLETYPRDDLFQIDEDMLFQFSQAILKLDERPRVRVLPRDDRFDRFVSVIVYVPRDRYSGTVRERIGAYLADVFHGHVSGFHPFFTEGPMIRVQYIIGRDPGAPAGPARPVLDAAVAAIVRTWVDEFGDKLAHAYDPRRARALFERYRDAFSNGYCENYSPDATVRGLRIVEGLSPARPLGVHFHRQPGSDGSTVELKIWSYEHPIRLSDRVPVLENMGFQVVDERTYRIDRRGDDLAVIWFHDMALLAGGYSAEIDSRRGSLEAAFLVTMGGAAENDGYNALVLHAGLMWRDVALIRSISRFLRQIRVSYSQDYMWSTLVKHASVATEIVNLFHERFDPRLSLTVDERGTRESAVVAVIEAALTKVESLDEDRILRHFVNAVLSAVRTNFYQLDTSGQPKPQIAIKYASRKLDRAPLPRPLYEIFVYSPRVEAVHLRFGKVARGGIRWSDRPQDFRTEVLGLVKAQQVKNAVIVPVGAKGGFVPKALPGIVAAGGNREAVQAEGTATYKLFMSTLLDITDNLGDDGVIPPDNVVRHDGDDPYLVVAADKGTATFSDIANAISAEHDFWLDDAFASGGSAGYDHKKMGITARGAWESVKRHFREMDVDIGATVFTVVGVGDMSGDVFGNGMLREKTMKLVAAFDHRDIFIDPDPDPAKSFAERQRLFDLPRSSWQDYDKALISSGGGVFPRSLKEITLSPAAQAAIGFDRPKATPGRDHERDPEGAGRPAVLRRHRHLCARLDRDRRRGRRPRQRRGPRGRRRFALQGDRRGRQPRHDPARPDRGGPARRAAQHRRHRQFGRRQHLGRRSEPQDRARGADACRPPDPRRPQRPAGADDRRRRGAGAAQQLPAAAGDLARTASRPGGPRLRTAADADAGSRRRTRPRGRVPARRHGDRRAPSPLAAADAAGDRRAAGLRQAVAQSSSPGIEGPGRSVPCRRTRALFPGRCRGAVSRRHRAPPAAA